MTIHAGEPGRFEDPESSKVDAREETIEGSAFGDASEIYRDVARALRGESAFPVSASDALELTRLLDAIRLSDKENRVVVLN